MQEKRGWEWAYLAEIATQDLLQDLAGDIIAGLLDHLALSNFR